MTKDNTTPDRVHRPTSQWVRLHLPDIAVVKIGRRLHIVSACNEQPLCGERVDWDSNQEALSTASGPLCRRCAAIQGPEYADV